MLGLCIASMIIGWAIVLMIVIRINPDTFIDKIIMFVGLLLGYIFILLGVLPILFSKVS